MWQVELHTWAGESGGSGSAVYMTRDAGATWKKSERSAEIAGRQDRRRRRAVGFQPRVTR